MAIRKKTKYLVRFFLSKSATLSPRKDIEYCGNGLQECIAKLRPYQREHLKSFTIYENGNKVLNIPISMYGKL